MTPVQCNSPLQRNPPSQIQPHSGVIRVYSFNLQVNYNFKYKTLFLKTLCNFLSSTNSTEIDMKMFLVSMLCEMNLNLEIIELGEPKCVRAHCNLGAIDISFLSFINSNIWGQCLGLFYCDFQEEIHILFVCFYAQNLPYLIHESIY